ARRARRDPSKRPAAWTEHVSSGHWTVTGLPGDGLRVRQGSYTGLESTRANVTACRTARGRSGGFVVPGRVRVTRPGFGGAGRSGREPVDDRDTGPRYQPAQPVAVRVTVIATARAAGR